MKKGGWLRRDIEKAKAWLKERAPIRKVNKVRKAMLHEKQYGPPSFGDFVRSSGCVVARQSGSLSGCLGPVQHCHLKSRGSGGGWHNNSFGACVAHHAEEHNLGQQTFEKIHNLDLDLESLAITSLWETQEYGW